MRLPLISTILKDVSKKKFKKDRVRELKSHWPNKTLAEILYYAYSDDIEFDLPEGEPPYNECDVLDNDGGLYRNSRKLRIFVKGGEYKDIPAIRKETLFVELLESIHPEEAKLVLAIKDKKIPYRGITKEIVQEAFPNLL